MAIDNILELDLFSVLPEKGRSELAEMLKPSTKQIEKGRIIALMGDEYNKLILVCEGALIAEMVDGEGRVIKVESMQAPAAVATAVLFANENYLPVQLRAERDSILCSLKKTQLLQLCTNYPELMEKLLRDAGNKIAFLASKIQLFKFKKLNQKIASFFIQLSTRQKSSTIKLPYSIEGMAELFGVSRPGLSRCLSEMVEEGLICRKERLFVIEDVSALEDLIR